MEKPRQRMHYDYHDLVSWLYEVRPGACEHVERSLRRGDYHNGSLGWLDIKQHLEDMRRFPAEYMSEPYTTDDLEWLRAEIGDSPAIHYWW